MNTLDAIAKRTSVRSYKPEQIPEDALQDILKAGMAAPVGSGAYDSLHITVIQDTAILNKIADVTNELIFKMLGRRMDKNFGAPTMIIASSKPAMMPGIEYANVSTVLENMAIAATDMGIDNIIWAGAAGAVAQNTELSNKVGIPDGFKPILCASFGYATDAASPKEHSITVNRV